MEKRQKLAEAQIVGAIADFSREQRLSVGPFCQIFGQSCTVKKRHPREHMRAQKPSYFLNNIRSPSPIVDLHNIQFYADIIRYRLRAFDFKRIIDTRTLREIKPTNYTLDILFAAYFHQRCQKRR